MSTFDSLLWAERLADALEILLDAFADPDAIHEYRAAYALDLLTQFKEARHANAPL